MFHYNNAEDGYGGAIFAEDNVKIDRCDFNENYACGDGGAICTDTVTFSNSVSTFDDNHVGLGQGGAIWTRMITNSEV